MSIADCERQAKERWPHAWQFLKFEMDMMNRDCVLVSILLASEPWYEAFDESIIDKMNILENPFTSTNSSINNVCGVEADFPLACYYFTPKWDHFAPWNFRWLSFYDGRYILCKNIIHGDEMNLENARRFEEYLHERKRPQWQTAMRRLPLPISQAILEYM